MSDELIIRQCSPTLAGIKTGSLFSCKIESKEETIIQIRSLNLLLGKKGVRIVPLRFKENSALVYMYRPIMLKSDISDAEVSDILMQYGYTVMEPERCVRQLISRIIDSEEFPHEIGFFLGYPPDDVKGFIEHEAKNEKLVGYWKVYGDEERAKHLFTMYKHCTDIFLSSIKSGNSIYKLTVAV